MGSLSFSKKGVLWFNCRGHKRGRESNKTTSVPVAHYTYDENGNVKKSKDANGNRDRMISPGVVTNGARITDYRFDELNRNYRIEDPAGMVTFITYDPDGKQNDVFITGGSETKYKYDEFGRVLEQKTGKGDLLLF